LAAQFNLANHHRDIRYRLALTVMTVALRCDQFYGLMQPIQIEVAWYDHSISATELT
jgi:hypothetical protein